MPCDFRSRLASHGASVTATNSEAATVTSTAIGSERMKSPGPPGRLASGRNASNSTTVQPTTGMPISFVAAMAASTRFMPSRMCRSMFSTTTIESSTTSPSATTSPTMLSWLSVKPV